MIQIDTEQYRSSIMDLKLEFKSIRITLILFNSSLNLVSNRPCGAYCYRPSGPWPEGCYLLKLTNIKAYRP